MDVEIRILCLTKYIKKYIHVHIFVCLRPCDVVCGGQEDVDDELTDAGHHGDHDQREALSIIWAEIDNKS